MFGVFRIRLSKKLIKRFGSKDSTKCELLEVDWLIKVDSASALVNRRYEFSDSLIRFRISISWFHSIFHTSYSRSILMRKFLPLNWFIRLSLLIFCRNYKCPVLFTLIVADSTAADQPVITKRKRGIVPYCSLLSAGWEMKVLKLSCSSVRHCLRCGEARSLSVNVNCVRTGKMSSCWEMCFLEESERRPKRSVARNRRLTEKRRAVPLKNKGMQYLPK